MHEYFIVASTYAAPFFSETRTDFIEGKTPEKALSEYLKENRVYAANLYRSSDDYHKNKEPLVKWRSDKAISEWKGD